MRHLNHRWGGSMHRSLYAITTLLSVFVFLFAYPNAALANEGEGGDHQEVEVGGYTVTLSSQNEWAMGENTLVVTIADGMGMPLNDADVEILIAPKETGHESSDADSHDSGQQDAMSGMDLGESPTQESSMPGMDMGESVAETPGMMAPIRQANSPIAMTESEHGMYTLQSHLESSGEHDVHVMFHVDGEMLQADFVVEVAGTNTKTLVLWSFVAVNVALVASAGFMKKQSILVKGGK
jgi:hypothetical protein